MTVLSSQVAEALARVAAGTPARQLESATLEFKEEAPSEKETLRVLVDAAICFANADGGEIVLGVADGDSGPGAFRATSLDPAVVQRRIYEMSRPGLIVEVRRETRQGVPLLVLRVPQSPDIHSDPQGRAPRRVGRDCLPMTATEQSRLREERQGFDLTAAVSEKTTQDVSALALEQARARLATFTDERRKLARLSTLEVLICLGLARQDGRLLRAGEILFCPPDEVTRPLVIYQYRATPGGEPRAIERVTQPLLSAILKIFELIQARRNVTAVVLPDGQQLQLEDFPELAVREAVANAVIHRDYHTTEPVQVEHSPEVLVVTSPGPLVSGVTPDNILTHPSKPRNPTLARGARILGFAEEIGRGVDRMYREMIRSGRSVPKIESTFDRVRVSLEGGAPNTQIARFVAQLPEAERDDTDTLLTLFRLCSMRTVTASGMSPLLQKTPEEVELVLRRLASDSVGILEPTRLTARRARPNYRLKGEVLKALGSAVPYQRRTTDEIDRKVIAHVREYGKVTNRTIQNLFDMSIQRAKAVLADLVSRRVLVKISSHQRGPGVEYGPGPAFPKGKAGVSRKPHQLARIDHRGRDHRVGSDR